jgi:hypothetical protein
VASLDRKQRFDANKGLRIEAVRAASGTSEGAADSEPPESGSEHSEAAA